MILSGMKRIATDPILADFGFMCYMRRCRPVLIYFYCLLQN